MTSIANPMRGESPLGEYTLVFTFNAMCLLERESGLKMYMLLVMLETDLGFADMRDFIWAGLQEKHAGTSVEEAGDIIGQVGLKGASEALKVAMQACFAPEKAKGKNPREAA